MQARLFQKSGGGAEAPLIYTLAYMTNHSVKDGQYLHLSCFVLRFGDCCGGDLCPDLGPDSHCGLAGSLLLKKIKAEQSSDFDVSVGGLSQQPG